MGKLSKDPEEWIAQAEYDLKAAKSNLKNNYRFFAVFLCHLTIEKALKGLYFKTLDQVPPKTHNLLYLLNKTNVDAPDEILDFLTKIQEAHLATRYPEEFKKLQRRYNREITANILKQTEDTFKWIKKKL